MASPAAPQTPIQWLVASRVVRSGYTSAVVHLVALISLALFWIDGREPPRPRPIFIAFADAADPGAEPAAMAGAAAAEAVMPGPPAAPEPAVADTALADAALPEPAVPPDPPAREPEPLVPIPPATVGAVAARPVAARPAALVRPAPAAAPADAPAAAFARRFGVARGEAARAGGGSAASEAAVELGLAWLARHQAADGSWRFDLSGCRCDGGCRDGGTVSSTTAATGIALLPFLGAGHTQAAGTYRETVTRGLYYLMSRIQPTPRGGDMAEGTMYGQGVATLALAEALGMTKDDMLVRPLRDAVRFIVTAQDAYGGGWRYLPGQAGDTTVTAWQVAALKSAALAGLEVPSPTFDGVCRFLDRVEARGGEAYGYQSPRAAPCTSAIGLLCRMYTGWDREEVLDRGLAALAKPGPGPQAVYQNFYLAQALIQREHPAWPRWNARNRDQLVARQATVGHEAGSWFFTDPDTAPGGRLAHTALAVLTLEVYYRLLPIYGPAAVAGF
ncbi:MAG: prenyltransferase/squalene oxidase repeat-containing protein [Planctomycetia bacterium]